MADTPITDVLGLIGNTPLVRLNRLPEKGSAEVLGKLESHNPGGSIKDRICLSMIEEAEARRVIHPGATIVEPTAGNTGIGLAIVARARGYTAILTMPENVSVEKRTLLKAFGADIVLTREAEGMAGAIWEAEEIVRRTRNAFMPNQFRNPANPAIHRLTTGKEILAATQGAVDAFVAGVGTGGTLTGVGEALRSRIPHVRIVAVEPAVSAVLSGGRPGPTRIDGIGAGFVPEVLNTSLIDEVITVTEKEAYDTMRALGLVEGLLVGMSSGANVAASLHVAKRLGAGKRVVTILADTGERYFSLAATFEKT
jgi:cysteine synthase A